MRRALLLGAAIPAALAGCGGESGDLVAFEIGAAAGQPAKRIVVTEDGRGRCGGKPLEQIASGELIDAREVERETRDLAEAARRYGTPRGDRRAYVVRSKEGSVGWVEGTPRLPEILPKAQLLALRLDRALCR